MCFRAIDSGLYPDASTMLLLDRLSQVLRNCTIKRSHEGLKSRSFQSSRSIKYLSSISCSWEDSFFLLKIRTKKRSRKAIFLLVIHRNGVFVLPLTSNIHSFSAIPTSPIVANQPGMCVCTLTKFYCLNQSTSSVCQAADITLGVHSSFQITCCFAHQAAFCRRLTRSVILTYLCFSAETIAISHAISQKF